MIRLTAPVNVHAAEGEKKRRYLRGIAVPWDVEATVMDGTTVKFAKGALPTEGPAPKLIESHDLAQIRGLVTNRVSTDEGMEFEAQIAATRAGDDALALLEMGAIDSVSVGVNPTEWHYDQSGTMVITAGDWMELSLVAVPAFSGARIAEVAATQPTTPEVPKEDTPMAEATNTDVEVEASAPTVPTAPIWATAKKDFQMPSAAEYIAKVLAGGSEWAEFDARRTRRGYHRHAWHSAHADRGAGLQQLQAHAATRRRHGCPSDAWRRQSVHPTRSHHAHFGRSTDHRKHDHHARHLRGLVESGHKADIWWLRHHLRAGS
ncbi:MAG: HK97 family phage prohead protease [Ilumatobacteraceae bacterium]